MMMWCVWILPDMWSKNKPAMTALERSHVERIKAMPCAVCSAPPPSEAHEPEQGLWFLSIPLCDDCHRGDHNGLHGRKAIWSVKKITEQSALNSTLAKLFHPQS